MSGLNPISRAILRLADSIAGPRHSEWTAAMAAETDAADTRGTLWALGALSSSIALHWRDHPWRSLFLLLSPLLMFALIYVAMWPIAILERSQEVPQAFYFAPILSVQLLMGYLIGRGAPASFPHAGLAYFLVTMIVVPTLLFALITGRSVGSFGPGPILGVVFSIAVITAGTWWGYSRRAARLAR